MRESATDLAPVTDPVWATGLELATDLAQAIGPCPTTERAASRTASNIKTTEWIDATRCVIKFTTTPYVTSGPTTLAGRRCESRVPIVGPRGAL